MRISSIFFVSGLCAKVYGGDVQQVLSSSFDPSLASYTCENGTCILEVVDLVGLPSELGVKPSVACMDPSLGEHSCSCTCSNGLRFEQSLPSYSLQSGGSSSNGSLDACHAAQDKLLAREQDLADQLSQKQQELLRREQELLAELEAYKQKPPTYMGCYAEQAQPNNILTGRRTPSESLTSEQCSTLCDGYKYFGLYPGLCFCGDSIRAGVTIGKEEECTTPCNGNATQQCGGTSPWRTRLYQTTK
jgi:hypothetical protein